jgi:hypothetical protein
MASKDVLLCEPAQMEMCLSKLLVSKLLVSKLLVSKLQLGFRFDFALEFVTTYCKCIAKHSRIHIKP